jgi:hypothetical protein
MNTCPCCSDILLRHIDQGSLYWFCRSCWAAMPSVEEYRARQLTIASPEPVRALSVAPAPLALTVNNSQRLSLVQHRGAAA